VDLGLWWSREASAPYPMAVGLARQVGQHDAALSIRDDKLDEIGEQILCLGNNPDSGFRTLAASNYTGDVTCRRGRIPLTLDCAAGNGEAKGDENDEPHAG